MNMSNGYQPKAPPGVPNRPPFPVGVTCRGCYALGTACGRCERCAKERHEMLKSAIVAELKRQEAGPGGEQPWVKIIDARYVKVDGDVDLDALAAAIFAALV